MFRQRWKWQPTPVFLPGESHGQQGLVGCSLWGCKESDTTKQLTHTHTGVQQVWCSNDEIMTVVQQEWERSNSLNILFFASVSSVAQLCPTVCNPMDCSTPGFPIHHQLLELTQTHVHRVSDAIQQSHPLLSPSPPTFNLSQHQGLFQWVSSSH